MDILSVIDYNIKNFSELFSKKKVYLSEIKKREEGVKQYSERLEFLKKTKTLYLEAIDLMYQESVGVLQETLNSALQYVMTDKDYSIKLELEDKRGVKTLNISLVDNKEGFEVDLKDGTGLGVRTIVSFVLKSYYLVNENSKILMLDEKYSALSAQYIPYFMEFLKKFTEEKDIIIVMITHDNRFVPYGDTVYTVSDGFVRRTNIDNGECVIDTNS